MYGVAVNERFYRLAISSRFTTTDLLFGSFVRFYLISKFGQSEILEEWVTSCDTFLTYFTLIVKSSKCTC